MRTLFKSVAVTFVFVAFAGTADAQSNLADAMQKGDRKTALALIAQGADVNKPQADGTTPLHWAAYRVDRELLNTLLKKGAKPNVANRFGSTPLADAARVGEAEQLVRHGADINRRERFRDQSALMWAAGEGQAEMVAFLVSKGANVNIRAHANE